MATVASSFTAKGVSAVAAPEGPGNVSYAVSNTFDAAVYLEKSSPSQLSWERVAGPLLSGASGNVACTENDRFRMRCYSFVEGDVDYTFTTPVASGVALVDGGIVISGPGDVTVGDDAIVGGDASFGGYVRLQSISAVLTATGADRDTALQLAAQVNRLGTVATGTGVILPVGVVGDRVLVFNDGADAAQVYASGDEEIDTVAGATGVVLTEAKRAVFLYVAAGTWISAQLGAVSA